MRKQSVVAWPKSPRPSTNDRKPIRRRNADQPERPGFSEVVIRHCDAELCTLVEPRRLSENTASQRHPSASSSSISIVYFFLFERLAYSKAAAIAADPMPIAAPTVAILRTLTPPGAASEPSAGFVAMASGAGGVFVMLFSIILILLNMLRRAKLFRAAIYRHISQLTIMFQPA
jgi:hypothetical protein